MMEIRFDLMVLLFLSPKLYLVAWQSMSVLFYLLQVWGAKEGPYEFKPAPNSGFNDMFSHLNFPPPLSMGKKIEGSFVLQE